MLEPGCAKRRIYNECDIVLSNLPKPLKEDVIYNSLFERSEENRAIHEVSDAKSIFKHTELPLFWAFLVVNDNSWATLPRSAA